MRVVLLVVAGLLGAPTGGYVETTAAAWQTDPVYVDPGTGALSDEAAGQLRDRIEGWRDDVHLAVLPAVALDDVPGPSRPLRARSFLDALADERQEPGVYVVAFGGVGTYGAAYGTDDPVGPIVVRQVQRHTLGQLDQTLDGILDDLGAPEAPRGGFPWLWVVVGVAVALTAGAAFVWRRRAGPAPTGPADYTPSFRVQPDEADTVEERAALAREDVTRLGEQLDHADLPATDPAVAEHVQAALDAYYEASRRVDALSTDDELRQLREITDYSRWQHSCAVARLHGAALPQRRSPCFMDPAHGMSVADWKWAPEGGVVRPVPVCAACLADLGGSR